MRVMKITRVSPRTGLENTLELPISEGDWKKWLGGMMIQEAMPHLTASQREFVLTGTTEEDWQKMFPPICDSCERAVINKVSFELRCSAPRSAHYGKIVEPEDSCDQWKAS